MCHLTMYLTTTFTTYLVLFLFDCVFDKGEVLEDSKERVRQYNSGWSESTKLEQARKRMLQAEASRDVIVKEAQQAEGSSMHELDRLYREAQEQVLVEQRRVQALEDMVKRNERLVEAQQRKWELMNEQRQQQAELALNESRTRADELEMEQIRSKMIAEEALRKAAAAEEKRRRADRELESAKDRYLRSVSGAPLEDEVQESRRDELGDELMGPESMPYGIRSLRIASTNTGEMQLDGGWYDRRVDPRMEVSNRI